MQPLGCKENKKCLPLREMLGTVLPCLLCLKRIYESSCRTQVLTSIADSYNYPSWKLHYELLHQNCHFEAQCSSPCITIHRRGMDGKRRVKETQLTAPFPFPLSHLTLEFQRINFKDIIYLLRNTTHYIFTLLRDKEFCSLYTSIYKFPFQSFNRWFYHICVK